MTIFMFTFLLFPAYNAHKAFEKKEYEKAKDILQTVQVEKPNDPLLNYNLGVIDYKKKNFDAAKQNFSRAATSAFSSNDKELLEKAYFNLGNSFYQNARKILVEDWEKSPPDGPAPDEAVRNQAISETKSAIKKYDKILEIKQNQKQAQTNKKASEAFLQKLIKQQQEEKKKENKKDKKDKKEENKQDKQEKKEQHNKAKEKEEPKQKTKQSKNIEERQLQALLDRLQESEEKLQKKLMKLKIDKEQKPQNSYQKPW